VTRRSGRQPVARFSTVAGAVGAVAALLLVGASAASGTSGLREATPPRARPAAVATLPNWGYVLPIDRPSGSVPAIASVSCPTESFCAAVDNSGNVLVFKGRTWSRPANLDVDTYGFTSVSCATRKFCVAVDADGFESTWNGARWSVTRSIDTAESTPERSVSCPTVSFCAVVDQYGSGDFWNGKKWTKMTVAVGGDEQAVSCVSSSFCVAGDIGGAVYTWNGSKWSKRRDIDPGGTITSVSCVKGPFCVAAGSDAETLKGSTWTAHGPISKVDLESAACASPQFCVVGDYVGDTYVWAGGRWSLQGTIDPDATISGLSCPSKLFCSAVDSNGNGLFWARPPLITTLKLPDATKSQRYVTEFSTEGGATGPCAWHRVAGGLPRGLTLSVDGEISGTPKAAGTFHFFVRVSDPLGQHSQRRFEIEVNT